MMPVVIYVLGVIVVLLGDICWDVYKKEQGDRDSDRVPATVTLALLWPVVLIIGILLGLPLVGVFMVLAYGFETLSDWVLKRRRFVKERNTAQQEAIEKALREKKLKAAEAGTYRATKEIEPGVHQVNKSNSIFSYDDDPEERDWND